MSPQKNITALFYSLVTLHANWVLAYIKSMIVRTLCAQAANKCVTDYCYILLFEVINPTKPTLYTLFRLQMSI